MWPFTGFIRGMDNAYGRTTLLIAEGPEGEVFNVCCPTHDDFAQARTLLSIGLIKQWTVIDTDPSEVYTGLPEIPADVTFPEFPEES